MRFGFLFNEVLTGLRRNVTMTVAMILTTAISIGLFGGGLLVVRLADHSKNIYLDRVESAGLPDQRHLGQRPDCDADPCKALRAQIESRGDVESVRFLNRDDAYDDAIRKFPQYKDVASKDAFPASFIVKLDDPEQHKEFDQAIAGQPGVLNVLNQKDLIDRLFAVLDGLSQRGVRGGVGAGGRRGAVDRQHGSGGRLHPTHRDRHHATGRRQSVVHPAAVLVGGGAGRAPSA